jgi:hypothetical protein
MQSVCFSYVIVLMIFVLNVKKRLRIRAHVFFFITVHNSERVKRILSSKKITEKLLSRHARFFL